MPAAAAAVSVAAFALVHVELEAAAVRGPRAFLLLQQTRGDARVDELDLERGTGAAALRPDLAVDALGGREGKLGRVEAGIRVVLDA